MDYLPIFMKLADRTTGPAPAAAGARDGRARDARRLHADGEQQQLHHQRRDPQRALRPDCRLPAHTKLTTNPYIIVVTPSLPVKTVSDLINLATSKPDTVTYASSGTGGVLHLGGELLATLANIKMTHVPYKGVADGYPAMISGQVNWMLGSPISAQPLMKAGRMRGIAVTSEKRLKALPELPAIGETVPGYKSARGSACSAQRNCPQHRAGSPPAAGKKSASAERSVVVERSSPA